MACTTILVGKKASYDGSTMIARNDDSPSGKFHVKKMVVVDPKDQPRHYQSVLSHVEVDLPDNPLRYTAMPNVDKSEGIWAAAGINEENVAMTATETITSNPRVLGADPYVNYVPAKNGEVEVKGGIGEEELVVLVLPYIHSAKEGALRLGALLEKYGTYEPNGIAFSDQNEIWWLESIGGHHWIARRVKDEEYVVMPNQFGLDRFDFADAYGAQKENLCSSDLKDFVEANHLDLGMGDTFNPRIAFGSHDDSDHVYNTPRAWFMERYLNPRTYVWDGPEADFTPEADDIPWSLVPEKKITVEDVKYVLSSHFQGTPYDPYGKVAYPQKGIYRPIGISRTAFMSIAQIRGYLPKEYAAIEWVCFGSNAFNAMVPLYSNVTKVPEYFSNTTMDVSTDNFYWSSRLLGALADAHFGLCAILIERYQNAVANRSRALIVADEKDKGLGEKSPELREKANEVFAQMAKEETAKALNAVLYVVSCQMKNGFNRSDN
jgi:dipeptidase